MSYRKNRIKQCFVLLMLVALLCSFCSHRRRLQVILISIDALRPDHLTCYGYQRDTSPQISLLAKDAFLFRQAYANAPWTFPSHLSLLTGTLPSRHGVNMDWETYVVKKKFIRVNEAVRTMADLFRERGANTIEMAKLPAEIGFGQGFAMHYPIDPFKDENGKTPLFRELELNKQKDFFLFIHTNAVHAPYCSSYYLDSGQIAPDIGKTIDEFYRKKMGGLTEFRQLLQDNHLYTKDGVQALYDGCVHDVDRSIGELVATLRRLRIYDNVMIMIVSDHGEPFGEHFPEGFYDAHGSDFLEEFIRVPLIFKLPGQRAGQVRNDLVSLIDVLPSALDFYGVKCPALVQGVSLWKKSRNLSRPVVAEAVARNDVELKMIRLGVWKYIVTMERPEFPLRANWDAISERRLFNVAQDRLERYNLFGDPARRWVASALERKLRELIEQSRRFRGKVTYTDIDKSMLEHFKTLGYLNVP